MKTAYAALALAVLTFTLPASAQEARDVPGSPDAVRLLAPHLTTLQVKDDLAITATPVDSGRLMLDVIEGRTSAAVVALSLREAMNAAREAAAKEGRTLGEVPDALSFHEVGNFERGSRPVGFVTLGAPSPQLQKALGYLRSTQGLYGR